jgi:hypothetical protein
MNEVYSTEAVDAITLTCVECGQSFSICRSCWRGQKCCSKICSAQLRRKKNRIYQKTYSSSEQGLESGRVRQARRYAKIKILKKSH